MSTLWKNISLEYLIVHVNHYEIQIDHGMEKTLLRTLTICVYPSLTDKKHFCNCSWTTLPTSCQAYISFEILRERREIADLFNKYALYFRIYLIHVTIPIIQSYIQSSLSNKIFQKHV